MEWGKAFVEKLEDNREYRDLLAEIKGKIEELRQLCAEDLKEAE